MDMGFDFGIVLVLRTSSRKDTNTITLQLCELIKDITVGGWEDCLRETLETCFFLTGLERCQNFPANNMTTCVKSCKTCVSGFGFKKCSSGNGKMSVKASLSAKRQAKKLAYQKVKCIYKKALFGAFVRA